MGHQAAGVEQMLDLLGQIQTRRVVAQRLDQQHEGGYAFAAAAAAFLTCRLPQGEALCACGFLHLLDAARANPTRGKVDHAQ